MSITIPSNWMGTAPEFAVWQALKKQGVNFDYQSSQIGGRLMLGGAILDFYIPDRAMGINIQEYYDSTSKLAVEKIQKTMLESQGIKMVYIDEDAALSNPEWYVAEALRGIDHSRMAER